MKEIHNLSIKLSLDKLKNLLEKNGYVLERVYCHCNSIIFIECRTPKYQKTFVIHIPERYFMEIPPNYPIKRLNISYSNQTPTSRQIKFISDIKGTLLECDLLMVSSDELCFYLHNGDAECFYIKDGKKEELDSSENESEDDEIDLLEKDTSRLLQKITPGVKLPKVLSRKRKEDEPEEDEPEEDEHKEGKIELFFEDDNGMPLDEVKSILENPSCVKNSLDKIKKKIENVDNKNPTEETEEYTTHDNSLPPEIEESDVTLGIIYVLINISQFFKIVAKYEDEILNLYNQIEDNEEEMRQKKLTKVKGLCTDLISSSEKKLKEISDEEKKLKNHLIRLTVVLAQASCLKEKVEKEPSKYGNESVEETNRIYKETRGTIYELNMEILKLRDLSEDLLYNYIYSLQELLEL